MESFLGPDSPLDYVEFQMSVLYKRYEAFVFADGKTEKVASGLLEHLLLNLPAADVENTMNSDELNEKFILQLPENLKGSAWFTKSTLFRFLHLIGEPDLVKTASAIEDELIQLEETRKFHCSLYAQGQQNHSQIGVRDGSYPNYLVSAPKPESQIAESSEATKNELLRAIDLRLMVLREELTTSFNRALGETCSDGQIADIASFVQHFGAVNLRNYVTKYLALCGKKREASLVNEKATLHRSNDDRSDSKTESVAEFGKSLSTVKPVKNDISPAKIAQAERHSSSESEESCYSSDEDPSPIERSRSLARSASPWRSASPMRRIQIGRSGSRRATALTIKNLSNIPAREKASSNKDAAINSSEAEECEQPPKRAESAVTRMSVQDAINLFESKQRDQRSNIQKGRNSTGTSVSTNKSVLRRWSAGMGEASQCTQENFECVSVGEPSNSPIESVQEIPEDVKQGSFLVGYPNPVETAEAHKSLAAMENAPPSVDLSSDVVVNTEESADRAAASAEWNRQKEAELNQMLIKMLETKPARHRNMIASTEKSELSSEQKGGLRGHYKEKRNMKIQGENPRKQAEKEMPFKAMQQSLGQRKVETASKQKNVGALGNQVSSGQQPQRIRRSSTSVPPKRESSKPAASRKSSPKSSPLPTTRNSWPSMPSSRSINLPSAKLLTGTSSVSPSHRRPQTTQSQVHSSARSEESRKQQKGVMGSHLGRVKNMKSQEKKQHTGVKSNKSVKTKTEAASIDDSESVTGKPSFYNMVTKKSSVVPLEPKPFLRKGTGIGPGSGPVIVKTKTSQLDESSKNSGNLSCGPQENEAVLQTEEPETAIQLPVEVAQPANNGANLLLSSEAEKCENTQNKEHSCKSDDEFSKKAELEIQTDHELSISPTAWVDTSHQELSLLCDNGLSEIAIPSSTDHVAISSPRVRHSLSQMLQADSGEPDVVEWGNAENPPALIYQKESPKGLKRLLKFARKSKGEANVTGWASPSIFSEGEEDGDEPKATSSRNVDALSRKGALLSKVSGQHKTMLSESYDGGNSSKSSISYASTNEILPAQSNASNFSTQTSHKLREGKPSTTTITTKASRSFFSLPTFRSSKSSEAKLRG